MGDSAWITFSESRAMRPTARVRRSSGFQACAKLCRQYLKWFGNATYKHHHNGERWLLESLRSESIHTVLDVGANVGKWALMAVESLPSATIYALEAVPATAALLRKTVSGHTRIRPFELGLAAESGSIALNYDSAASTHATVTRYPQKGNPQPVECAVMAGDEFLVRQGLTAVDFLKLDVEGAEHLVLQGLEGSLRARRIRMIQFEYGRVNILTHFLLRDFYELFESYGYCVGKIYPDFVDFRAYDLNDEDFLGPNYLACLQNDAVVPRLGKMA
ncbi:MAG TPA: FkbM family methyltransferase [Gemmatimonadales bacterium]|nr:FkbM family methyltransferase [Gemmatimonadales bacterium]